MPAQSDPGKQATAEGSPEFPQEAILAALDRVVSSEAFGKAERPARFLRHVVKTALRGEGHILKESVLGTDVFDRPATWDPRLDPVVRQEAARLRKRLARYYEGSGAPDEVRIEMPVGSYVPVFRRKSSEAEPAPLELPPEPPVVEPVPMRAGRVWLYAAAAILCVGGGLIAWRALPRDSMPSIAVLPFSSSSTDPANQYFADGLTDEIIDSLAQLKTVRVIARSSTVQFKGKLPDIGETGRLLHVANILEGSIDRAGERIRIIAHLERVADNSLVWSKTYETGTSDLFALQSELAADIARSLNAVAANHPAQHVPNAEAHEALMKARYDMQQMTTDSLARAEAEYQHAIDLDPQYAAAYMGLGNVQYNRFAARGSTLRTDAERKSAEQLMQKALALDPGLVSAHALLAVLVMQYDWDWRRAERELQLASAGSPNSNVESQYSFLLVFEGRFAEADRHLQRMLDLDPFSTATMNNLAVIRNLEGRFVQAREIAQRMAAQYPGMIGPQLMMGGTQIEEGHPELALPLFRAMEPHFPPAPVFEAMACAAAGQKQEALRLIHPFEGNYSDAGFPMDWFALVYALMGDQPNTIKWLQRSVDRHEWQALGIAVNPVFASMRNTPEFRALKTRIGL